MQTKGATAIAEAARDAPAGADGGTCRVTAASFRALTARLSRERPAAPPLATIIPMRKSQHQHAALLPEPAGEALAPRAGREPGEEPGDTAILLLDLMASGTGLLPQERALAADTLLLLLPHMPTPQVVRLAERVAIMDTPPPLLVARLIRDPRSAVAGPVLERSAQICDREMIDAVPSDDVERLRLIARRRVLSPVLSGHLVSCGDPGVILALLRNPGAQLPHRAFARLRSRAAEYPVLLAPLATRAELPAEVAFDLYWELPPELRRLVHSRFLADSGTLGRILRVALAGGGGLPGAPREESPSAGELLDSALAAAAALHLDEAARHFAELAGIAEPTARRILSDRLGEPAAVLLKALGVSRARFLAAIEGLRNGGVLLDSREPQELQAVFDGLSFTKARMLVTYWDWLTRKDGPYAPAV